MTDMPPIPEYDEYYCEEEQSSDIKHNMWIDHGDDAYSGAYGATKSLPPGVYDAEMTMSGIQLRKLSFNDEGLVSFDDEVYGSVMRDITSFWNKKALFVGHKFAFKRGILMYGPPGTGKSCLARMLINDVADRGGICLRFGHPELYIKGMSLIRSVSPDIPVVVLMEDIESIMQSFAESSILNVLDGVTKINGVVYLATTNYPELLGERIINRPSRFDRRIHIGPPGERMRREYLEGINRMGVLDDKAITKMVGDTETMTFAHIKELFIATVILEKPYDDVLQELRDMYNGFDGAVKAATVDSDDCD